MKKAGHRQAGAEGSGSWRNIKQEVRGLPMSKPAKARTRSRIWRALAGGTLVALVAGGIGLGIWYLDRGSEAVGVVAKANPIEEIILVTDGVLSDEWINRRLQIPAEAGLMDVDIQAIKTRLESDGQVAAATISRRFPSTLVVSLNERTPVARLVTRGEDGGSVVYLVAVDGVLYKGFGYDEELIARIPFLDGIRLVRRGGGFAPISRLDDVVSLFTLAEQIAPHLVGEWRIVALDRRPFIVVRTREVNEIIFEPGSYRNQLARLDYILDYYRRSAGERPARIDLSFKNQAAVELAAGEDSRNPQNLYSGN
ncbi:MAG: FtsQ-type POTRA domain-containing protein [Opitutaceae bacterium]